MLVSFNGTGNHVETLSSPATGFHIYNNGSADLTFSLDGGSAITVPSVVSWDDDSLAPFTTVTIVATSTWLAYTEGPDQFGSNTVLDALVDVRLLIADLGKVRWSDWELLRAMNAVYRMMVRSINEWSSSIFAKDAELTMTNNQSSLPQDMDTLIAVTDINGYPLRLLDMQDVLDEGAYRILGNTIYSGDASVVVYYRQKLPALTSTSSPLLLPEAFYDKLVKFTAALASGKGMETPIEDAISADVMSVAQRLDVTSPLAKPYWNSEIVRPATRDYGNR